MTVVAFTDLDTPDINSGVDATSYLTASWTPPTAGIITCWVNSRHATGQTVATMSGNSLTWVSIASVQYEGTDRRITLFAALASGATTGQTTIDFGANTQVHCSAHFLQAENVDTSGGIAAAFVQTPSNSGTATSGSVTLAAAGHADNRPVCFFDHATNEAATGDAAYTTDNSFNGAGGPRGLISQYDTDGFASPTVTWTTSSAWGGMAAEIKASVSGSPTIAAPAATQTASAPTPVVEARVLPGAGAATISAPTPGLEVRLAPGAGAATASAPTPAILGGVGQVPPYVNVTVR